MNSQNVINQKGIVSYWCSNPQTAFRANLAFSKGVASVLPGTEKFNDKLLHPVSCSHANVVNFMLLLHYTFYVTVRLSYRPIEKLSVAGGLFRATIHEHSSIHGHGAM